MLSRMATSRGSRHSRPVPPGDYTDLSHRDIELLAPILRVPSTSPSAHETRIRQEIADLPSHLRSRHPKFTTSCSMHEKINPLPITSVLEVIKRVVSDEGMRRWYDAPAMDERTLRMLEDMNGIWMKARDFMAVYDRSNGGFWRYLDHDHKCAGCNLAQIAKDIGVLVALGGVLIAGIPEGKWKKSKRIRWMEEWIKASVPIGQPAEGSVLSMWDFAVELLGTNNNDGQGRPAESRAYIADFVAQVRDNKNGVTRGEREKRMREPQQQQYDQDKADYEALATSNPFAVENRAPPTTSTSNPFKTPTTQQMSPPPPNMDHRASNMSEAAWHAARLRFEAADPRTPLPPPPIGSNRNVPSLQPAPQKASKRVVASSVYSRGEESEVETPGPVREIESQIIDSYRDRWPH